MWLVELAVDIIFLIICCIYFVVITGGFIVAAFKKLTEKLNKDK